jgi:membrane-associated HD superfamily phosphohydrolase
MKRGFAISIIFLLIAATSFASAASLSELLNQIDEATLVLFAIFLIVFVLLFFSLKRVFRGDTTTSGIISVMLSLLITYGVNKTGLDIQGLFSNIGISGEILSTILPIVILGGIVFLIIFLAKNSLLVIGGVLILLSNFVYASTLLIVIGIILIVIRFFIKRGVWEMKGKKDTFPMLIPYRYKR